MVAGAQEDISEVAGWYLNILRDTYSDTTNVKYTLSCIRPGKIIADGVGVPHLGAAGCCAWPKIWEGPRTHYIIYNE